MVRTAVFYLYLALACALHLCAEVRIATGVYEGAEHFIVRTSSATYWYDRAGGGLSRIIDSEGRDWISFRREPWNQTPASAGSSYRGLPNFVFGSADSGAGHPGFTQCVSRRSRNSVITTSKSGAWRWMWTFHDDYAEVTLERAGSGGYWFLYEGTPGGTYSPANWFWGNDRGGPIRSLPDFLAGERSIENLRWAYFGDTRSPRVLFVVQREIDDVPDSFGVMGNTRAGLDSPDGMVVFGFGRGREAKPLLQEAPRTFLIGLVEQTEHTAIRKHIEGLLPAQRAARVPNR